MRFIKYSNNFYATLFFVTLLGAMMTLSMFLIIEYRFFKKQALGFLNLKADYQNYIVAFKRVLYDYNKLKERMRELEADLEGDKKSLYTVTPFDMTHTVEERAPSFLVVNREFDYLRSNAIEFSKKHDLEGAVKALYEFDSTADELLVRNRVGGKKVVLKKNIVNKGMRLNPKPNTLSYAQDMQFQWPMAKNDFWLGSKFGPRKKTNGTWGFHYGLDMPAPKGTPVKASAAGVIVEVSHTPSGYGKSIVIAHNKKYKTRYAHLDMIAVKNGQKVVAGERIGRVGATGAVRGKKPYHLHFEVSVFGEKINPLYVLS